MKREAHRHPKLYALASYLGCNRPAAIGYLTLLIDFTRDYAIQGNIGKHPNGAIAGACDWTGDPDAFIDAFVRCGLLDEDETHRLLVHDYEIHCETWIKAKLSRLGLQFAKPTVRTGERTGEPTSFPSHPIPSNPIQTLKRCAPFAEFWNAYPQKKAKGKAEAAWKKLQPDGELLSTILQALKAQAGERQAKTQRGEFVPEWKHPATWLNARCWEDAVNLAPEPKPKSPLAMHEDADAKRRRDALTTAQAEQRRWKLKPQMRGEDDDTFVARINRDSAEALLKSREAA